MFIHEQRSMPVQRICSIAFGDKDLNDQQVMREYSELHRPSAQNRLQRLGCVGR